MTLDDAFAYAGALGAQPSRLMAPMDNTSVEVFPAEPVEGHFRAWLRGHGYVRPDGVDYMPAEVAPDQWWERCNTSVLVLFHAHRELLEAIEVIRDTLDANPESAAVIADLRGQGEPRVPSSRPPSRSGAIRGR